MTGSRSKFRFSWLKVNNYWKSPKNVNSLRPILSPKNAKKGRGPSEPPPPAGIKVIMQGKLFQRCIYLLYCSVLSLVGNINTGRMSQADMGSIFNTKNKWNILVIENCCVNYQNYQNVMLLSSLDTRRTLVHLFLFTNSAQRELVSICTQSIRNCN